MILSGSIKLSRIFQHSFDRDTDRLYQPLRNAVQAIPALPSPTASLNQHSMPVGEMKCSQINISRAEQDIIKNSTFIPINQKLVETNNPEKRIKARSRSYRTLSVEQRIGSPMPHEAFKEQMAKKSQKVEIVYDYDLANRPTRAATNQLSDYYVAVSSSTMARTRSATYVGGKGVWDSMTSAQKAQAKVVRVERKQSNHSSTSLQLKQASREPARLNSNQQESSNGGEYYENCKRYSFKKDIKASQMQAVRSQERMAVKRALNAESDYKYNLFNVLDQPINTKCSTGLCHNNHIIAPKIKKRW